MKGKVVKLASRWLGTGGALDVGAVARAVNRHPPLEILSKTATATLISERMLKKKLYYTTGVWFVMEGFRKSTPQGIVVQC